MQLLNDIPDSFYGLFRSPNRAIYMEALLKINEEYEYNDYFLSREVCIQTLSDHFARTRVQMEQEELENDMDVLEPMATRVLNWLLKTKWLRKLEDYSLLITNIIIPDYSAVFIEAFEQLTNEETDNAQVYIQNIYAILFSYRNDKRNNPGLLHTALINTRKLNKSLQDMLHNMDRFFTSLLEKETYEELLKEHLEGYVEQIINKKYHILKTTDNFYLYKNDISRWIGEIREQLYEEPKQHAEEIEVMDRLERGFHDIEHRIANMDREHIKYVRATVSRLNYLLSGEQDTKGMILKLLSKMAEAPNPQELLEETGKKINFSRVGIFSDKMLYQKRQTKKVFEDKLEEEEEHPELSKEQVLSLNQIEHQYSKKDILLFLKERTMDHKVILKEHPITEEDDFEKLILAYDAASRKNSRYKVETATDQMIKSGGYVYPDLIFYEKYNK